MANIRETVQEAFESVRGTVQGTVNSVKGTVEETVGAVQHTAEDVRDLVNRYPWLFVGGFAALGYLGYRLLAGSSQATKVSGAGPSTARSPADLGARPHNGRHPSPVERQESQRGEGGQATQRPADWASVMQELTGLAVGVPLSIIRDKLATMGAEAFRTQVCEVMDTITEKLGGKIVYDS